MAGKEIPPAVIESNRAWIKAVTNSPANTADAKIRAADQQRYAGCPVAPQKAARYNSQQGATYE